MPDDALPADEVERRLEERPEWTLVDGRLHRDLTFADFTEAFAFMTRTAAAAERLDHHPDWSNSWNKVVIDITSHAAGGITARCFELAAAVDEAASSA
ncbi:MAG: 4a-hydroxytetrahydrobiopterin dehydratase [Acidimicrobiales bacterium]